MITPAAAAHQPPCFVTRHVLYPRGPQGVPGTIESTPLRGFRGHGTKLFRPNELFAAICKIHTMPRCTAQEKAASFEPRKIHFRVTALHITGEYKVLFLSILGVANGKSETYM